MSLLQRHYLKEFLKLFALLCVGLSLIVTLLDLVKRMDDLLPHGPGAGMLAYFAAMSFPRYFLYMMPVAALLCSLFTVGHASKTRELTAVMAAGGRIKRLLMPIVISGLVLSFVGLMVGEFAVPYCSRKAKDIKNEIRNRNVTPSAFREGTLWLRAADGSIVKIGLYVEETGSFRDMSIFKPGSKRIEQIVLAEEAVYSPDKVAWVLKNVRDYNTRSGEIRYREEYLYSELGSPDVFSEEVDKFYEMGMLELWRYLRRLNEAGFKNLRLSVELNSKVSYPLVSLFMVLLGVAFTAQRSIGGLVATAIGLVVSLLYWLGYTMSLSLGYAGILPPFLAAWLMPVLFGSASVYLYWKIPQ